ncbi:unnamed protein product [Calypogeia fissa]
MASQSKWRGCTWGEPEQRPCSTGCTGHKDGECSGAAIGKQPKGGRMQWPRRGPAEHRGEQALIAAMATLDRALIATAGNTRADMRGQTHAMADVRGGLRQETRN